MPRLTLLITAFLSLPMLAACDEDPAGPPTMVEVAGSYEATTLIGHAAAGDIDVLSNGGSLEMELAADGTTSGTLFVPEGEEDGSDLTADLTGTWSLDGDRVTFAQAADTFIRDVTFTFDDGRLVSNSVFADVVLTRR